MSDILQLQHYINGHFVAGHDYHAVHNPAKGTLLAYSPQASAAEVAEAMAAARAAQRARPSSAPDFCAVLPR